MNRPSVLAFASAITCISVIAASSTGLAYNKPSEAQQIMLGTKYSGDTESPGGKPPFGSVWRLPGLLAQDRVTLTGEAAGNSVEVGLAGDVDDYDYVQLWKNNFSLISGPGNGAEVIPENGAGRFVLQAREACGTCFLEFGHPNGSYNGTYSFTVESIQHAVGLGLTSVATVKRKGSVRGTAYLTNGAPVPDGFDVALIIRKGPKKWVRVGRTAGGQMTFRLNLPKSAKGKVRLSLSRSSDSQYLAANTRSFKTRIN